MIQKITKYIVDYENKSEDKKVDKFSFFKKAMFEKYRKIKLSTLNNQLLKC